MTSQAFLDERGEQVDDYDIPGSRMEIRSEDNIPETDDVTYKEVIRMDLSMLSVDIKGYSTMISNYSNKKVLGRAMRLYVNEMTAAIRKHGGTIVSIEGDGIIGAFSNTSEDNHNSQESAVRCAVTMATLLKKIVNEKLRSFQKPPLECRYGVDYSRTYIVRAGVRGGRKNDLIFIGDALSSAVKIQNKAKTGYLFISYSTYENLSDAYKDPEAGWKWYRDGELHYVDNTSIWDM